MNTDKPLEGKEYLDISVPFKSRDYGVADLVKGKEIVLNGFGLENATFIMEDVKPTQDGYNLKLSHKPLDK